MSTNYANLPPHIIVDVLKLLSLADLKNAVQVCKSWYNASCCISLGHQIKSHSIANSKRPNKCIKRPFSRLELTEVNLNRNDYKFMKKFAYCIRELYVTRCSITFESLVKCLKYLTNLERLHVVVHSRTKFIITNNVCSKLPDLLGNMKILYIECCAEQSEAFNFILSRCIYLSDLTYHIYRSPIYDLNYNISKVYRNMLNAMARWPCVHLNTLEIINRDDDITPFFQYFNRLNAVKVKKLKLFEILHNYNRDEFQSFCKKLASVEELEMGWANDIDLEYICQYMQNLRYFYIKKFDGFRLGPIHGLKQLKIFKAMELKEDMDENLHLITSNLSNVTFFKITRCEVSLRFQYRHFGFEFKQFLMLHLHLNDTN